MGLFDNWDVGNLQGGGQGVLPPWLGQILQNTPPDVLAQGLQALTGGFGPQPTGDSALPATAQPASLAPQPMMDDYGPRKSIFDRPDSVPGDRMDGAPQGSYQPSYAMAPQPAPQGAGAMAQAPMGGGGAPPAASSGGGFQAPTNYSSSFMSLFAPNYAKRMDAANVQNLTVRALVNKGVDPTLAAAAAGNPALLAQIAPSVFEGRTKPEFKVIGHDQFGNPQYGFVDPGKQSVSPYQQPGASGPQAGGDPSLTGEEYLKTLPQGMAAQVKAIVEGRQQPPGGFALKSPMIQQLLSAAGQYEPGFDLTKWTARAAGNKDFYGGGKSAEMVRAANQTIHHVGALVDSMDKLSNTQFPMVNAGKNFVDQKVMGGGAVTEFLPNAHAVAEEMSKVFKGANLSDAEIKQWEQSLNPNMSPEQQKASVGKLLQLLNGSLEALENKRNSSLGESLSAQKGPLLDDKSRQTLEKVNNWIAGQGAAPNAAGGANPAPTTQTATGPNGQKLILQNGQWVPMK